jgi:hypothetical protein
MQILLTAPGAFLGAVLSILANIAIEYERKPKLALAIEDKPYENNSMVGSVKSGTFLRVCLSNKPMPKLLRWLARSAAYECTGIVQFCHQDGTPVFAKPMQVRWAGSDEPVTYQLAADSTLAIIFDPAKYSAAFRRDCFPGTSELFDVAARFDNDEDCYGWSNDSYLPAKGPRHPDFKLSKGRYLVKVTIRSSGDQIDGVFQLENFGARADFRLLQSSQSKQ